MELVRKHTKAIFYHCVTLKYMYIQSLKAANNELARQMQAIATIHKAQDARTHKTQSHLNTKCKSVWRRAEADRYRSRFELTSDHLYLL